MSKADHAQTSAIHPPFSQADLDTMHAKRSQIDQIETQKNWAIGLGMAWSLIWFLIAAAAGSVNLFGGMLVVALFVAAPVVVHLNDKRDKARDEVAILQWRFDNM